MKIKILSLEKETRNIQVDNEKKTNTREYVLYVCQWLLPGPSLQVYHFSKLETKQTGRRVFLKIGYEIKSQPKFWRIRKKWYFSLFIYWSHRKSMCADNDWVGRQIMNPGAVDTKPYCTINAMNPRGALWCFYVHVLCR